MNPEDGNAAPRKVAPRTAIPGRRKTAARVVAAEPEETSADGGDALDLTGLSDAVGYALRRAQMAVFADFSRRFSALGLKPVQFTVLQVIGNNPDRKQSEVAAALGIQPTNFVAMLDELERRGFCNRARSDSDRRSYAVALTKKGYAILKRAHALVADQEREITEILGAEGREALVRLASRLAATW